MVTPKARKPLRRVSDKQRQLQDAIRALRPAVIARDGQCRAATLGLVPEVRCWGGPPDMHHWRSRGRGGERASLDNLVALCRAHHIWVDEHQAEAEQVGLLRSSWDTPPGG